MRYEISRAASAVIDEIIRYTDKNFGEDQTAEYVGDLYNSFELIADNPQIGKTWDGPDKRRYIFRQHLVFYRVMSDHVLITDIRNARQSLPPEWRT